MIITRKIKRGRNRLVRCGLLLFALFLLAVEIAPAQVANFTPNELKKIDVVEKLGETIPLNVKMTDSQGRQIQLGDIFSSEKPVIIILAYYNCPMLCSLVLNGLTESAKAIDLLPGKDYHILTLSIEPKETPELAAAKKENYIKALGIPEAEAAWYFCVADSAAGTRLANSLGFKYYWDEVEQQWAHPAVLHVMTSDGVISRYLYGLSFKPHDLKLSLLEASRGNIGTTIDRIILYCFHYDPDSKGYVVFAGNVMRLGGVLTIIILGAFLGILGMRYRVIGSSKS